ncbi:MAG: TetR/AcrR family transcriptional regulator [Hyphomonadaceae bacterium]|nr:TetR/AcrR family transcriptional regulator [Hyphomonadaceae bacterium]
MSALAPGRERILAAARDLFQRKGFHAVGLSEILAAAKAPKGVLYHHFPEGKDALGAAAVRGIGDDVTAYIAARRAEGASGEGIVTALAAMSARFMAREGFAWSPLIAAVAHQAGPDTPRLAEALVETHAAWRNELARTFEMQGAPEATARSLAATAIALLEGAAIVARIERDTAPLDAVGGQVARLAALEQGRSLDVPGGPS